MGLTTRAADHRPVRLAAAEQQLSFKMNERGARAEAVTRMSFALCAESSPPPDFVINEPFIVEQARGRARTFTIKAGRLRDTARTP
jgi:hypothetical protein